MSWVKITFKNRCKNGIDREEVIERVLWQEGDKRVVEGIVYEHKTLYHRRKKWEDSQQHLIGYHYFILEEKVNGKWKDIEGFQGNIKDKKHYTYFIYNRVPVEVVKHNLTYDRALKLFNKRNGFNFKNEYDKVVAEAKKLILF